MSRVTLIASETSTFVFKNVCYRVAEMYREREKERESESERERESITTRVGRTVSMACLPVWWPLLPADAWSKIKLDA